MFVQRGPGGWALFSNWGGVRPELARVRFAARDDGRLGVAEMHLEGRPSLTSEAYRSVPLTAMEAWANGRGREELIEAIEASGAEIGRATDEWLAMIGYGKPSIVEGTWPPSPRSLRSPRSLLVQIPEGQQAPARHLLSARGRALHRAHRQRDTPAGTADRRGERRAGDDSASVDQGSPGARRCSHRQTEQEGQADMTPRAGSATPRKDPKTGRWFFVVDGGIDPETGKRRQAKRRGFPSKKAAQEVLDEIRGKARTNAYTAPSKVTVAEYLPQWIAGLPATGLRPSTVDGYKRNCDYVIAALGTKRLDTLTPHDLDAFYSNLLVSGRRQKQNSGLSPRSVRYIHQVTKKALADAVKKGTLARNVADAASPPSAKSTKAPEQSYWTPDDARTFLAQTADEPLGAVFHVALMTGMRRGETCGLRWSDVDLDAGAITVRQQLLVVRGAPNGGLQFSERTKTDHGLRRIDLDPVTVEILTAHKSAQAEAQLRDGWRNCDGLVFTQPDGSPLDPESVAKSFDRRVRRSGLRRLRFHDLRHTHVAHLIA